MTRIANDTSFTAPEGTGEAENGEKSLSFSSREVYDIFKQKKRENVAGWIDEEVKERISGRGQYGIIISFDCIRGGRHKKWRKFMSVADGLKEGRSKEKWKVKGGEKDQKSQETLPSGTSFLKVLSKKHSEVQVQNRV